MPNFVKMATLDDLPVGAAKEVEHEGRVYAIFNVAGTLMVIDGICPHQGGPLAEGMVEGTIVTCPWHGWQFDMINGKVVQNPGVGVDCYATEVRGQDVFVDLGV